MRIAHISDCYCPRTGGIETQVRELARRQAQAGHHVRVVTATVSNRLSDRGECCDDHVRLHRIGIRLPVDAPLHPRAGFHIQRLLRQHRPDIVHAHIGTVSPFTWSGIRAARELGLPTLVTVHNAWGRFAERAYAMSDAGLRWSRWPLQWSAVSEHAADRLRACFRASGPVLVVPNGIDPGVWLTPQAPIDANRLRIVTVVRFVPWKRVFPFIRIVAAVRRELGGRPHVDAAVVGDGVARVVVEALARRLGLSDAVRFTGRLPAAGVRQVFGESDIYVHPARREAFGIAALEARAAGLPLVVRAHSGPAAFVRDGLEGFVADDDEGLVRAIVRLGRDSALRAQFAQHNRDHPPLYVWPYVLQIVADAYARAIVASRA